VRIDARVFPCWCDSAVGTQFVDEGVIIGCCSIDVEEKEAGENDKEDLHHLAIFCFFSSQGGGKEKEHRGEK